MGSLKAIELAQALIRKPSVTPRDAGALDVLQAALSGLGFETFRLPFGERGAQIDNLYARIGSAAPNFCFAGHTDVVPPGDEGKWRAGPFAAEVQGGALYGRGAADMKGAIAAFVAAAARHLEKGVFKGSISLLITGDEEGPAVHGTVPVLGWLKSRGDRIDHCLVGEPTNEGRLGDTIKIGRRASLTADIRFTGVQGHSAYPQRAKNPIPALVALLDRWVKSALDEGTEHFQASTLEIVTIDVGNPASNVIPASAFARINIRFNDSHSHASLRERLKREAEEAARSAGLVCEVSFMGHGEPFVTAPGPFTEILSRAVQEVTGVSPRLSTSGGTSDARFIHHVAPVAEFGLVGASMHKIDEHVPLADLEALTAIYERILELYFERFGG